MIRRAQSTGRNSESGYALITILFLLGVVAVMLARSLPRDAMSAERTREETLIYRGEQYARAVKLYFREHQRYPETLDDLEETDGVRYLRRRYRDPMTGDDEWRLIKMGTDGRFEDSLVYDTEKDDGAGGRNTPAAQAFAAVQLSNVPRTPNAAVSQRISAAPTNPFQAPGGTGGAFAFPGQPGAVEREEPEPVRPDGQPARGAEGDYSQVLPGQVPTDAGQRNPRLGPNGVPAAISGIAPQQAPAYPGQPLPVNAGSAQATNLIGDLLTRPRPGGLAGLQGQMAPQEAAPTVTFQEGIAGVASKSEGSGVKVYKDRESFNEWEFVYDYRQDPQVGATGAQTAPAAAGGNINQGQPGLTPSGILGGNPGARQGSPYGMPGMNTAPPPQPGAPPVRRDDPPPAPQDGGRRTRRTMRPRSPAEFRPATPVPPTPEDPTVFPGQVQPENPQENQLPDQR